MLLRLLSLLPLPLVAAGFLGVDLIYWKPYLCSPEIIVGYTGANSDELRRVYPTNPNIEPGLQLSLCGSICGIHAEVRARYLRTDDSQTVTPRPGEQLFVYNVPVDFAIGHLRILYREADLRFPFASLGCLDLFALGSWVDIERNKLAQGFLSLNDFLADFENEDAVSGGGPGVEILLTLADLSCITLTAHSSLSGIVCRRKMKRLVLRRESASQPFPTVNRPYSLRAILPHIGFGFVADWGGCWNSILWRLRLGYEANFFLQSAITPQRTNDPTSGAQIASSNCQTIGFGGPFVGLRAGF